jgi:hypothetical protein
LVRLLALVDRARVEERARLDVERVLPDERPLLLERAPVDERPVLFALEVVVRLRPEPPLEPDPDPPLLACGIFPPWTKFSGIGATLLLPGATCVLLPHLLGI